MSGPEDALFGKIAIQLGLITPGQLSQLLGLSREFGKPIGAILTEQGLVTPEDMQRIVELRRIGLSSDDPPPEKLKSPLELARRLVKMGALEAELADECLRDLAVEGYVRPFEELLLERGVISKQKLDDLKALQERRPMHCPKCHLNFVVRSVSGRKAVECPRCKGPLAEGHAKPPPPPPRTPKPPPKPSEDRPVIEIKTTVMKAVVPDFAPEEPPYEPLPGESVRSQCVICDVIFDQIPDPDGRLKCPQCGSTFEAPPP